MSKFMLKLVFSFLLLSGAFLFLSGGHAAALNAGGCGTPPSNPPTTWGNAGVGGFNNQMASVTVYANDSNNNPVNVNYTLQSYTAAGQPAAQIYQYSPALHSYAPGTATNQKTFRTGEFLNGDGGYQCAGWDEVGPGIDGQDGNGYVVNCDDGLGNGVNSQFHYFITHIDPPAGQTDATGTWAVFFQGSKLTDNDNNNPGFKPIVVTNGSNVDVQLIWTPNPPPSSWTLNGNSSVDKTSAQIGDTVTFTHQVKNNGPSTARYTWKVMKKFPGDSGYTELGSDDSGGTVTVGSGNYSPNQTPSFPIPGGASDGDKYCEYIYFTNAAGGGTGAGQTNPVCVTVTAHGCSGDCCGGGDCGDGGCKTDADCRISSSCHTLTVNPTDGEIKVISIQGTNGDVNNAEIDPGDTSQTWNYDAVQQWVTITFRVYDNTGTKKDPVWTLQDSTGAGYTQQPSYHCYHASCSVQIVSDGQGPGGTTVLTNHQFTAKITVTNDNTDGSAEAIPAVIDTKYGDSSSQYRFSVTEPPENGDPNYEHHDTGFGLNPPPPVGDGSYTSGTVFANFTAPSGAQVYHLTFFPDLEPRNSIGDNCTADVPVYQHFHITPTAYIAPGTNPENPYESDGTTKGISYIVGGSLTDGTTTAATTIASLTKNTVPVSGGSTGDTYGANITHQYDYPDSAVHAGDQYCPSVTIRYGDGYHGPPGYADLGDGDVSLAGSCLKVVNEPYFKVYDSAVSARNGLNDPTGACSATAANSGLLAGWNDNAESYGGPSALDRGSGTELSALALLKITGVASARTDMARSTVGLTFANTNSGDISSSIDSPSLGGNYGGTPTCATPPSPKQPVANLSPSPSINALPASSTGNYKYTAGNLILNGGTVNASATGTAIFVNGDVYINSNITYNQAAWTAGSVPSFVLVATGNIYVAPGVTELDGTYIAQPKNSTTGGTIYTCGVAVSPTSFQVNSSFTGCSNRLVVNGSFSASNVKLLRTFGSMRDEEPTEATHAVHAAKNGKDYDPGTCYQPGFAPNDENSCHPNGNSVYDLENYNVNYTLNLSETRTDYTFTINYDNFPNGPWPPPASIGYNYTIAVYIDGTLRTVSAVSPSGSQAVFNIGTLGAGNHTVTIGGYNNYWIPYAGNPYAYDPNFEIQSVSIDSPGSPPAAHVASPCSNAGSQPPASSSPYLASTCAAEIFEFSPEEFLTQSAPEPPNKGAPEYDAITSLPPVL